MLAVCSNSVIALVINCVIYLFTSVSRLRNTLDGKSRWISNNNGNLYEFHFIHDLDDSIFRLANDIANSHKQHIVNNLG